MDEFDQLAEQVLPCEWPGVCFTVESREQHIRGCQANSRRAIAALLRRIDANARWETWEKIFKITETFRPHQWAILVIEALRKGAETEKDANGLLLPTRIFS